MLAGPAAVACALHETDENDVSDQHVHHAKSRHDESHTGACQRSPSAAQQQQQQHGLGQPEQDAPGYPSTRLDTDQAVARKEG
jgi:hypothetical protein